MTPIAMLLTVIGAVLSLVLLLTVLYVTFIAVIGEGE